VDLRSISLKSTKSLLSRWNAEQEPRGHKTGGYLRTCPSLLPFRPRRGANPTQRWRNLSMYVNRGITTVQVYHYKTANARLYEPILRSTMPAQESFMRGPVRGKASWKAADECAQDPHVPQRARTASPNKQHSEPASCDQVFASLYWCLTEGGDNPRILEFAASHRSICSLPFGFYILANIVLGLVYDGC
jgi:hypothetical protein